MNESEIKTLLGFIKEVDRLKTVERQTLIHSGGRRENSAEHSWHLAMAVFVFHSMTKSEADLLKCLKMAIFHDVVEVDAGDTFVYGDQSEQNEKEVLAINRLSSLLPEKIGKDLRETWLEFEEAKTPEAKFVKALDRFLPVYANLLNNGYTWKKHGISGEQISRKNRPPIEAGIPELWPVTEKMLSEFFDT
jgi:putative hydrolase of HD superfamily